MPCWSMVERREEVLRHGGTSNMQSPREPSTSTSTSSSSAARSSRTGTTSRYDSLLISLWNSCGSRAWFVLAAFVQALLVLPHTPRH